MNAKAIRWIYILEEDFIYDIRAYLPTPLQEGYAFLDREGKCRLEIRPDGKAVVLKGYAWDGCTPKWSIFDILVGTPDGAPNDITQKPKTYYASLLHDALCQFVNINPYVPRPIADKIFRDLLKRDGFAPWWFYYAAVWVFGRISQPVKRRQRQWPQKSDEGRRKPISIDTVSRP